MYNHRLLQVVAVVVVLMAVATTGLASLDNPSSQWIGPEWDNIVLMRAAVQLDNPNSQWIGPETFSAALDNSSCPSLRLAAQGSHVWRCSRTRGRP